MFVKLHLLLGIASIFALIGQGNAFCKSTNWGRTSDGPVIVGPVGIPGSPSYVNIFLPLLLPGCDVVGGLAFTCDSPDDTWLTFIESETVNVSRKKGGREGTLYGIYYCEPFIPRTKVPNRMEGFQHTDFPVRRTQNK